MRLASLRRGLLACLLAFEAAASLCAENPDEENFFSGDSAEAVGAKTEPAYAENFTRRQAIRFGGNFKLLMETGIDYYRDPSAWTPGYLFGCRDVEAPGASYPYHDTDKVENTDIDLQGSLFFSARPTDTLRLYGKSRVAYPFNSAAGAQAASNSDAGSSRAADPSASPYLPNIKIWELFADFDVKEKVFFRAGKQMIKWGANPYAFWSPADVVSLGSIDINDRGQDLEGPFAIKANLPFGDDNLDFYMTSPGDEKVESLGEMGYAARAKFLLGGWELGTGGFYSKARDIKCVATASGSLWKLDVWGEALASRRADDFYMRRDSGDPSGYSIGGPRSDWFFSGTAGLSYADADLCLDSLMLQYYFNGAGTRDMAGTADRVRAYLAGNPTDADSILAALTNGWTGMHYLAVSAEESFVHEGKLHLVATWLANLSDGSGFVKPGLNVDISDEMILGLAFTLGYGPADSQFMGIDGVEGLLRPRLDLGLSLSLGTSDF
jgi:hypothetical protein